MTRAIWKGVVVAESDHTVVVEENHYFPTESLKSEYFRDSGAHTDCDWKGRVSYLDVVVDGEVNEKAAWYYLEPTAEAAHINGRVAFSKGVQVGE